MTDLQLVLALCELLERQNQIIKAMTLRLGELGDVSGRDELEAADNYFRQFFEGGF